MSATPAHGLLVAGVWIVLLSALMILALPSESAERQISLFSLAIGIVMMTISIGTLWISSRRRDRRTIR